MKSYRRKDHEDIASAFRQALEIEKEARNGNYHMLTEMAIPLKTFLIHADGLRRQIATNWCLCKWCQMFCPDNENFNHWKEELASNIGNLNDTNIKNGINKHKHLYKQWVVDYDFDDVDTILRVIANKFYKENIFDMDQREAVADEFAKHIGDVIDVISGPSNGAMAYVKKAFAIEER